MSDFLLIVPEGWKEVPFELIEPRMSFDSAQQVIAQELWWEFEAALEGTEYMNGKTITNVKLFMSDTGPKCWILFVNV